MNYSTVSHSLKNNPMVPLDFKSLHTIPDSHEWNKSIVVDDPNTIEPIPIIDLTDPNAVSLIKQACEKWGLMLIINHGVPMNIVKELELQTYELFSLPSERKACAHRSEGSLFGYGVHRVAPFFPKLLWSEGFTMLGSPLEHAAKLWPHQPDQQTNFCTVMEEYQKEMKKLSGKMMELMLESLGLDSDDVEWFKPKMGIDRAQCMLQLNSYPTCPDPDRAMGLAPHTDSSILTILHQSSSGGLQIHEDGIGWIPVNAVPGSLVVNVGDFMDILSNGKYKSLYHRAVVNNTHHRISVAFFYVPPSDVKNEPLKKLIDDDNPPIYSPVTWAEYLQKKSYLDVKPKQGT
ncbi:putative gibberellin 3-beta-dioxygenase [Lupinus albus]|uniref:gibberellin 3beta-dioxygenase n=1 Tax=Lupinus albus TaxID=3870 RepID=A0A6A4Q834_LUPAL|nr:putative gibberellin 3-beta-dioxygenase [Lupinus albus]